MRQREIETERGKEGKGGRELGGCTDVTMFFACIHLWSNMHFYNFTIHNVCGLLFFHDIWKSLLIIIIKKIIIIISFFRQGRSVRRCLRHFFSWVVIGTYIDWFSFQIIKMFLLKGCGSSQI